MTPCVCRYPSPLGELMLAADSEGVTGAWFVGQKYFAAALPAEYEEKMIPVLERACVWLDCYFRGQEPDFMPPIHLQGSPFRMAVWELLRQIPYGRTTTYGEIARELAARKGVPSVSAQAVGGAVGHNPISIIVPCHRVVGRGGNLTGYAGGIDRKVRLLTLEGVDGVPLFVPHVGAAL